MLISPEIHGKDFDGYKFLGRKFLGHLCTATLGHGTVAGDLSCSPIPASVRQAPSTDGINISTQSLASAAGKLAGFAGVSSREMMVREPTDTSGPWLISQALRCYLIGEDKVVPAVTTERHKHTMPRHPKAAASLPKTVRVPASTQPSPGLITSASFRLAKKRERENPKQSMRPIQGGWWTDPSLGHSGTGTAVQVQGYIPKAHVRQCTDHACLQQCCT